MKYTIIKRFITFLLLLTIVSVVSAENATPADTITTEAGYIQKITNWYSANMNYYTVAGLMAIESSFIPFPSEIVVPPAAAVSVLPGSKMNIILIILFATLGSLIGALVNYFLSMTLGRTIIYKFADSKLGHLCLLNSDKIRKAENYFNDHGKVSTFIGRLIPGIRQLISIPAGLARMPLFLLLCFCFTLLSILLKEKNNANKKIWISWQKSCSLFFCQIFKQKIFGVGSQCGV